MKMTLSNKMTISRLIASPILFLLILFYEEPFYRILAFVIFLGAALTDLYDGYLARKYGDVTNLGKVIDPLADKFLLSAAFIAFYLNKDDVTREVGLWVVLIVLGREVIIMGFRYYSLYRGRIISASRLAKAKTLTQNFFIGSVLIRLIHRSLQERYPSFQFAGFDGFHQYLNTFSLWIVLLLTVTSGFFYVWGNRHIV
jgi:CDP-diacylglycerol--glycerol-3-phosphate 3-phosphatidyltransferase